MKSYKLFCILCGFIMLFSLNNIDAQRPCKTDEIHQQKLDRDPDYYKFINTLSETYNTSNRSSSLPCDGSNSITIPVAVHFDAAYDCSDVACLISATDAQIASLNDDFAALNADLQTYIDVQINTCGDTDFSMTGTCINFCLADMNHPAASGIPDGFPAITVGEYAGNFGTGGSGAPEWANYLNIFVVDGINFGVSDGIGGNPNDGSGVATDGAFFGGPGFSPCSSGGFLNDDNAWILGRTLTHEVGHYLGLYHTFQGGCGDEPMTPYPVTDTPAQNGSSSGCTASCAALETGCTAGEHVQYNYMDYFDDACLVMFTEDQAVAMNTHANSITWANDAVDTGCSTGAVSLAACMLTAGFTPEDGALIQICTDEGSSLQFNDTSTNGPISWDWTFAITSGDITIDLSSSTDQNPTIVFTSGTSGTIDVTLESCDVGGGCDEITQTYTISIVSGDDCPNDCTYMLLLTDTFGDGWNGATVEIFQNGMSLGVFGTGFTTGTSFGPINLLLTDGATIDFVQTNGGFPNEEGFELTDPFGNVIFDADNAIGSGTVYSFNAYCSPPTCDDGELNQGEEMIDCGGPCMTCPTCPAGSSIILEENFDACAQPADWTVSSTDGGTVADGSFSFNEMAGGVPSNAAGPPSGFDGCIAVIDDNINGNIGLGCITSPVIDLSNSTNNVLTFDWQHEAFNGDGDLIVEVWNGSAWVQIFLADDDSNGNNESSNVDAFANANFQVQFCYDDEASAAWGLGIDNISICGELLATCPDLSAAAPAAIIDSESSCEPGCILDGGAVSAPSTDCPDESTLEYSTDGINWSTTLPSYDQNNMLTVMTRCLCDLDGTTSSPTSSAGTMPGMCTMPDDITLSFIDNFCPSPSGIIEALGSGTITFYSGPDAASALDNANNDIGGSTTAPAYLDSPAITYVCVTQTDANGCTSPPTCGQSVPDDCSFTIAYDVDGSDPCDCDGNSPSNGSGTGTFSEVVTITTDPATTGLSLCVANGSTGIAAGTSFSDNNDGTYSVSFTHVDGIGYSLQVADCADLSTPLIPEVFSNVCHYPVINVALPLVVCENVAIMDLNSLASEISGSGDFMGSFTFTGSYLPGGNLFDPSANGLGSYSISAEYTPTTVVGDNPGTDANCPTDVMLTVSIIECDCMSTNGTINIQSVPGN